MHIITEDENKILMFIKNNKDKYPESVSYETIKDMFSLSETAMVDLLDSLEKKDFIVYDESEKIISYNNIDEEVTVVKDKSALKKYMLNKTEEDAYTIIQDVVAHYDNFAPKYILEGALLYGELELTPKRTYNIIVALENKNLLRKIERRDGEYYTI